MAIDAYQIIEQLKSEINNSKDSSAEAVGVVESISDGVARIIGLSDVGNGELVYFEDGSRGVVLNLESDQVGAIILDSNASVKQGQTVRTDKQILSIPVGPQLLGRVISPLGKELDGKGELKLKDFAPIENPAPAVLDRKSVNQPLQTGIKAIDSMIPIGKGQRELIIGDRQTGKTAVALDTIINQKGKDVICIYVAISQKQSKISQIVGELEKHDSLGHTVVVTT